MKYAFACLMALLLANHAGAFYSNENLAVVHVEEIADNEGRITFIGDIMNTNEYQSISPSGVFITLKKDGVVIAIISGYADSFDAIIPGEIRSFSVKSDAIQEDYDDFTVRAVGYIGQTDPNVSALTGGLFLVEESLNFAVMGPDSTAVILGELLNGTNGILTNLVIQFRLFKDEECLIGTAEPPERQSDLGSLVFQDLLPGETIGFIAYATTSFEKVARWEYDTGFDLVRLVPQDDLVPPLDQTDNVDAPTAVTQATWGQIKSTIHQGTNDDG